MNDTRSYFREIESQAAFQRASAQLITHPKKQGMAKVLTAYPKDGAGRLTVYIIDGFGDTYTTQKGTAGGYGYDKKTAALSGMTIDGHLLSDHCGEDDTSRKLLKAYGKAMLADDKIKADKIIKRAAKLGYRFANWTNNGGYQPNAWNGYQSLHRLPGFEYLAALGYRVIDVL